MAFAIAAMPLQAPVEAQGARRGRPAVAAARTVTLTFQDRSREYLLYVPEKPGGALVLVFHGGGQVAAQMQEVTGFDALADREQFVVAYPQAVERSWADGRNETSAEKQGIDDVGFAKAVVADIARTHTIDASRVFATGLSNGGILAHRLACEAADIFAAIAPVVAAIAANTAAKCQPSAPVAVVAIQGLADSSVPYYGGGQLHSSRHTEELWRKLNGCSPSASFTSLPVSVQDGTSVDRRSYAGCRGGAAVVWNEIHGGGHRWPPHVFPDAREAASRSENGVSSQNIDASEVIWAFFAAHGRG